MSSKVLRLEPLPAASDPALLLRLLLAVGAGERSPDALAEALDLPMPDLRSYLDAGVWLGLLALGGELRLTPRGLTLVAADPRRRRRLLAAAIWQTPEAAEILRSSGSLLSPGRVAAWLRARQPSLPEAKVARLSEAAASLLVPALEFPGERRGRPDQLALPFNAAPAASAPEPPPAPEAPSPDIAAGTAEEAEIRAREALLDEGELSLGWMAALVEGPPGPCADALARAGLAERVGDRLVATPRLAGGAGDRLPETRQPFLECLGVPGLGVAFPSSLAALRGGLSVANADLRQARGVAARPPGPMDPRARVHGGLLHPGEPAPRAIPDALSLRLRALQSTPAFALLAALLLLDRRSEGRLVLRADGSALRWRRRLLGTMGETLAGFGHAQGWTVLRTGRGPLTDAAWVDAAVGIGLARRAESRLVLDEALFVRLQEDVEASLVLEALEPLVAGLSAWIEARPRQVGG